MTLASTSSSSSQPPPPPPPPTRLQRSRSRSAIVEPPIDPVEIPVSRDTSNQPRAPSIASTTDYRSRSNPRKEPIPIAINTPREQSLASTADYRSKSREVKPPVIERSRSRNPENIVLPIKEESDEPRGRSMKTRNDKIIQQMLASQNNKLIKSNMRIHLGRFARNTAQQMKTPKEEPRPASEPPKKVTRSFDEIAEISERDIPFGASLQKQRVNSVGDERRRFRGQLIR